MIYQDDNYIKICGNYKKESAIKFNFICPKFRKKSS